MNADIQIPALMSAGMLLTTEHEWNHCTCTAITRIIDVSYPVEAEIHVRACAEFGRAPVMSAMDALAEAIGRHIISESDAWALIRQNSNLSLTDALQDVQCVHAGARGRRYYVKRDILKACSRDPKEKCVACGERDCRDGHHAGVMDFVKTVNRLHDGYVYFLLHAAVKFLKVGYSASPVKRLRSHRASIPGDLTTLGVIPGGLYLERAIHEELCDWLVPGHREWFFYSEFVRSYIDRIVGVYEVSPQQ